MKKLKTLIKNTIHLFILIVLIIAIYSQVKYTLILITKKQLEKIFKGKIYIDKIKITPFHIYLKNTRIDDVTEDYPLSFIFVEKTTIPIPYYKLIDKTYPINTILFEGAKVYIKYDKKKKKWNIFENISFKKKKKTTSNIRKKKKKSPIIKDLIVKNAEFFFTIPIKKVPMEFKIQKAKAYFRYYDKKLYFIINGIEKNTGKYTMHGIRDFRHKDFFVTNKLQNIPLSNNFNKFFIVTLLPFLKHYDFDGQMDLQIKIEEKRGKWHPITYLIQLKNAYFIEKNKNIKLKNFSGNLHVVKNTMKITKSKGTFYIKKLALPITNYESDCMWEKGKIELTNINSTIFNGTVNGNMLSEFNKNLIIDLHFKGCDFSKIADFYHLTDKEVKGIFFLDAHIVSEEKNNWDVFAQGQCFIRKGKFFKYPIFLQIFDFLNFKLPGKEKEKKVDIDWKYKKGNIIFENIEISNGSVDFCGNGTIKKDNTIDFILTTQLSKSGLLEIPLVGDITYDVSKEVMKKLVTIKITGTLKNPEIKKQSIERLPKKTIKYFINILKAVSSPLIGKEKNEKEN